MRSNWQRRVVLLLAGVAPLVSVVTCSPGRHGAGTIIFTDDDDFDDFFDDDDDFFDDLDDDLDDLFDD